MNRLRPFSFHVNPVFFHPALTCTKIRVILSCLKFVFKRSKEGGWSLAVFPRSDGTAKAHQATESAHPVRLSSYFPALGLPVSEFEALESRSALVLNEFRPAHARDGEANT
jgi:hypothetical protein